MTGFLINWVIITIAILIADHFISGIRVASLEAAIVGAAILAILNALVRPILIFLTLPITVLTLGLFLFVINALMFLLAGSVFHGFRVESFWPALLGSLIVSIVSYVADSLRQQ
jgi:putative membrane protein